MSDIPVMKPAEIMEILRKAGFHVDHQSGSHVVFHNDKTGARVVVPFHHKDLPKGTLMSILRASGISRNVVAELLYA